MQWHLLSIEEALQEAGSRQAGLNPEEVHERLLRYGANRLEEPGKTAPWKIFLLQFNDLMIIVLLAAATISGIIGDLNDTLIILVIVALNAIIGFTQEFKAGRAMEALKQLSLPNCQVRRENKINTIDIALLVPGDIVLLEAGNIVPADMRLIEAHALRMDESVLTGESVATDKTSSTLTAAVSLPAEKLNMVFKGTTVSYGRAAGLVTATGMRTEMGAIAAMLKEPAVSTPLQKRMKHFGKKLSVGIFLISAIIYITGLIRQEDPLQMLLVAVSIAVAAIPEALPAVTTVALAIGARRLAKNHALVRRLPAVETLGSVTYICSDKTGTLTCNKMEVKETWLPPAESPSGETPPLPELLWWSMILNQDTYTNGENKPEGDATELALLMHGLKLAGNQWPHHLEKSRLYELPFDSERKRMSTVHRFGNKFLVVCKGAPEAILDICSNASRETILQQAEAMSSRGMRVIAYAYKITDRTTALQNTESQLKCIGLAGLMDPPRREVTAAIAECRSAGIVPVMITGDHPATAEAIAHAIGLSRNHTATTLTGEELNRLSNREYEEQLEKVRIYARVSPAQKLRIVKALQQKNQFVAMTGDGVNDAPALQRADIGIAMGRTGTDVARAAAHMILEDDNFASIVRAVREGRRIYDNIRRFIKFILTGNSAEIWTIFLAPFLGLPIPLLPVHILWINLITDGLPSLALANEKAENNIMRRPPRPPGESLFSQGTGLHILWVGLTMAGICLALQAWSIYSADMHWQTMVFTVLCFSQLGHAMAIRSEHRLIFQHGLWSNRLLTIAIMLGAGLQLAIIYLPALQNIFHTKALTAGELIVCLLLSSIVFHLVEAEKIVRRWKQLAHSSAK